tara:strand:- start:316 stop:465 length:150 start_codon:yes stop_codon:yes gene_type:complete
MGKRNANALKNATCQGSAVLIFLIIKPPKLMPTNPVIRNKIDRLRFEIM